MADNTGAVPNFSISRRIHETLDAVGQTSAINGAVLLEGAKSGKQVATVHISTEEAGATYEVNIESSPDGEAGWEQSEDSYTDTTDAVDAVYIAASMFYRFDLIAISSGEITLTLAG